MAKPIFTVGIPGEAPYSIINRIQGQLEDKFNDYHVVCHQTKDPEPKFNVFYEKDFNEVNLEEIKEYIKDQLKE